VRERARRVCRRRADPWGPGKSFCTRYWDSGSNDRAASGPQNRLSGNRGIMR
jgi:hypothetical protein